MNRNACPAYCGYALLLKSMRQAVLSVLWSLKTPVDPFPLLPVRDTIPFKSPATRPFRSERTVSLAPPHDYPKRRMAMRGYFAIL